jgi:hypothetical protein
MTADKQLQILGGTTTAAQQLQFPQKLLFCSYLSAVIREIRGQAVA